ncbi:MAG: hypothetical protein K9M45_04935, partial [Kiritimatiellales bacterium]|nr:hypothetical protein [Kiritimatiellales bacterium]
TQPAEFETALITYGPWKQVAPDQLLVGKSGKHVRVQIDTGGLPFKVVAETIDEDVKAKGKPVRLAIVLQQPVKQATVTATITPAK